MIHQSSYQMVLIGITGIILFSISIGNTQKIIKMVMDKKFKKTWIFIEMLILVFLGGYCFSTLFALTDNSTGIASIAGIVYLFGSIFVIIVIYIRFNTIKEQKRTEQSLMQLNVELERRVEERTRSLEDTQEKMMQQEKFAAIGKLAGSVGHELRNPLGVITNSIYYLSSKVPASDEKIKRHLKIIQEQSDRANKIISDLLDFARTRPEETCMADIPGLIKATLEQIPMEETIDVKTTFDGDLAKILLDPRKMQQAFQNIIINVYQAMPDGGLLEITAAKNDNMIEIAFKDTGVGIPSENLPKIFKPLFSTKIKGIGLGLVITKEIVEHHGGKIEIKSDVGVGSTFTIKLPIQEKRIAFNTKPIAEEQVYASIVNLFANKEANYKDIAKIIVEVCSAIEIGGGNVDPKAVEKNALLLILGLLHKDKPNREYGVDLKSLPETKMRKIIRDLQDIFTRDLQD